MLHLDCTALSQSESSNFFMYVILTVMIRFSAPGCIFIFGTSREGLYSRQGAYLGQGPYFFFEEQLNVQNKNLTFMKKGIITDTVTDE